MRSIRMLRAMRRELKTELRTLLLGHEGRNPGHGQGDASGSRASSRPYRDRRRAAMPFPNCNQLLCRATAKGNVARHGSRIISPEAP